MKKFFALVCVAAFVFGGAAFAEPIKFPNGLTIDVAPGWSYEGIDDSVILFSENMSCAIYITVIDAEGMSAKDAAAAMSQGINGSEPQEVEEGTYFYTFMNEHGVESRVFAGVERGKLKVVSITGDHPDVDDIINSIIEE